MSLKKVFIFISSFVLFSCSLKIVKYEYIESKKGYLITIRNEEGDKENVIARFENGKKIQSEEEIKEFVKKYNQKPFDIEKPEKWKLTEKKKFKLAELYYTGLRAYMNKDFTKAIEYFNKTINFDKNVIKYSDIYYLMGKSYYYLNDIEKSKEYFQKFIEYSESISHPNFNCYLDEREIYKLFKDAEDHLKEVPEDQGFDLALKYHKEDYYPKYKNRYYKPGFVRGKYLNRGIISLGFYYKYSTTFGREFYIDVYGGMFKNIDFDLFCLFGNKVNQFYIAFPFSIFSDKYKRFGIRFIPGFYYTKEYLEEPDKKFWKSYINFSGDISMGYYVNHYWLLYTGYKYYYYNKEHPYKFKTDNYYWKLWYNNNFYIGTSVFFYKDFGATIEYSYENILIYFDILYLRIGFKFSEKLVFFDYFNLEI